MGRGIIALLMASTGGPVFAQNDAIGTFYELKLAPEICHWADAGDDGRLNATIDEIERKLEISASQKSDMMNTAEADLKSNPVKCVRDGSFGQMYDDAVQFDD